MNDFLNVKVETVGIETDMKKQTDEIKRFIVLYVGLAEICFIRFTITYSALGITAIRRLCMKEERIIRVWVDRWGIKRIYL